jgi:hypothetical protein
VRRALAKASLAVRAAGCFRPLPRRDSALLLLPRIGNLDIDGSLDEVARQTMAQLACFAANAPGGACVPVPVTEYRYLGWLHAQGARVHCPLLGVSRLHDAAVVVDCTDGAALRPAVPCRRHWRVQFDFRPGMQLGTGHVLLPYTMNPNILARGGDRALADVDTSRRGIRVLFAGAWHQTKYGRRDLLTDLFGKLTRFEVVSALASLPGVSFPEGADWIDSGGRGGGVVLADSARAKVPERRWLTLLRSADFLVCPPGCIMPPCFNLVEAMSGGTVPITNYPDWMAPGLVHGENCLVFRTLDDFRARIDEARSMPQDRVAEMRLAARRYYEEHLHLPAVFRRFMSMGEGELIIHAIDEKLVRLPSMRPSGAD